MVVVEWKWKHWSANVLRPPPPTTTTMRPRWYVNSTWAPLWASNTKTTKNKSSFQPSTMSNNIRAAMSCNFNLVGAPIHLMSRTNEEQGVFNDLQDDVIPG
jgi:hypothetical protein